ncbi:hypothetical protein PMIN03_010567 [Paraphaeosphaeria minitans]
MSVPSSGTQSTKDTLSRRCKVVTDYECYFTDGSPVTHDSSGESSSDSEDSEDDDDLYFIVDDHKMTDSEEEFVPHESSDDDGWSSGSDTCDDLTGDSDDAGDLDGVLTVLCEGNGKALSPQENLKDAEVHLQACTMQRSSRHPIVSP